MVLHAAAHGGEYFDSLGGAISHDKFTQFLGGEYRYVSVQTQELFSTVFVNLAVKNKLVI